MFDAGTNDAQLAGSLVDIPDKDDFLGGVSRHGSPSLSVLRKETERQWSGRYPFGSLNIPLFVPRILLGCRG